MAMLRSKIRWTIPGAGTAHTVLHFGTLDASTPTQADADEVISKVAAYAGAIKAYIPNVVSLLVSSEVEEINVATGKLIGIYTGATQTAQAGTASATAGWAAPAGGVISWSTAGIRNNRRLRGRTFIVPMSNEVWDVDGTLKSVPLTGLNTAAAALRAPGTQVYLTIYGRPSGVGASDGVEWQALAHRVPDMAAILTSRRS